jgi:hypothetical protein
MSVNGNTRTPAAKTYISISSMELNAVEASFDGIQRSPSIVYHESVNISFGHGRKVGRRLRRPSPLDVEGL